MLRPTDQKLENLYFLRDVTFPWMRAHPGRVNFDIYTSFCGTYACVWGRYILQRYPDANPRDLLLGRKFSYHTACGSEFGSLSGFGGSLLFGSSTWGTLDDRAQVLDEIIAEREAALGVVK